MLAGNIAKVTQHLQTVISLPQTLLYAQSQAKFNICRSCTLKSFCIPDGKTSTLTSPLLPLL